MPTLQVHRASSVYKGFSYFINTLHEALTLGQRKLNLEEYTGEVQGALQAFPAEELTTAKFSDHPLVAALSIAASELVANPYIGGERQPTTARTEYDLFDRNKNSYDSLNYNNRR